MKTNRLISRSASLLCERPLLFALATVFTAGFWLLAGSTGVAGAPPMTCDLCHKNTTTLTFGCNSLDYQRHVDHGDTMGACGGTPVMREGKKDER